MQDILPLAHEYIVPELTEAEKAEQASRSLLTFMAMAPNAPEALNG